MNGDPDDTCQEMGHVERCPLPSLLCWPAPACAGETSISTPAPAGRAAVACQGEDLELLHMRLRRPRLLHCHAACVGQTLRAGDPQARQTVLIAQTIPKARSSPAPIIAIPRSRQRARLHCLPHLLHLLSSPLCMRPRPRRHRRPRRAVRFAPGRQSRLAEKSRGGFKQSGSTHGNLRRPSATGRVTHDPAPLFPAAKSRPAPLLRP